MDEWTYTKKIRLETMYPENAGITPFKKRGKYFARIPFFKFLPYILSTKPPIKATWQQKTQSFKSIHYTLQDRTRNNEILP